MRRIKENLIQILMVITTIVMIILRFLLNEKGRVNPDSIRYMRTANVFPIIDNTVTPLGYPLSLKFFIEFLMGFHTSGYHSRAVGAWATGLPAAGRRPFKFLVLGSTWPPVKIAAMALNKMAPYGLGALILTDNLVMEQRPKEQHPFRQHQFLML